MSNNLKQQIREAEREIAKVRSELNFYKDKEFMDALKQRKYPFVLSERQVSLMYEGWILAKGYYK